MAKLKSNLLPDPDCKVEPFVRMASPSHEEPHHAVNSVRTSPSSPTGNNGTLRGNQPMKPQLVRIEVLGDAKVGKTSLICSLVSRHFSERVPAVLLNVQIPAEENNENVIISITDTSCTF